ncbi:ABC multidrug transporter [Pseudovirgaria hyperparasitica]|uniref:ABC multidrug transporter n=1 Tax=Pseudovirgaria hyperparasitica TaxID=470096 RepID=A0A6A6WDT8_9PEZI|nr:ABC multidrug transporter [Pseudovirgaria hyperparasitica]KAF2759281.1 ABC multidrug transporter [Pseudovirgaria hyperparasitica]
MVHPEKDQDPGRQQHNGPAPPYAEEEFESVPLDKVGTAKDLSDSSSDDNRIHTHATTNESVVSGLSVATAPASQEKRKWYQFGSSRKPPIPKTREVSHEYQASWFSVLTFHWIGSLMRTGYKRPLEETDIWSINPDRSAHVLKVKLNENFKKRLDSKDKRPLTMALYDTFKFEFLLGGFCQLMASILQSLAPFVLKYLIAYAAEAWVSAKSHGAIDPPPIARGVGIVIGIVAMLIIQTLCTNHFIFRGMMVGGQSRGVLISVIFDKAMKLSGRARAGGDIPDMFGNPPSSIKPGSEAERKWYDKMLRKKKKAKGKKDAQGWSNGRIVNLMSVDTYRVDTASGMFHMVWTAPVAIALTLILLIINITYSALAGFSLLVVAMPLLARAIRTLFVRRIAINKITDQRVALTQEILGAVRFVKYFGWELSFLDRLSKIRRSEIRGIQFLLSIRNAILAVGMVMPVFAAMIAFIVYSVSGHGLNPAPIFSSLALFNGLRLPLNFLPMVLGQVIDAMSSLERIQEFLLAEEASDEAVWDGDSRYAIDIKKADFTWEQAAKEEDKGTSKKGKKDKKSKKEKHMSLAEKEMKRISDSTLIDDQPFKIQGVDVQIGRNELVAVIGTVGCGKTSFLAALAGEMRRTSGQVTFGATRAFCPQYAWIQNATVRDNIVFGRPFNKKWYDMVVDACALRRDFEIMPHGDQTEIGEKGITVSGGQKQRLNIARAIYFNSDIVIMDDPLSAVDAHVGKQIMDEAICGLLANKCRVLATHQLHVLNRCDRIILMDQGRIAAVDTFDNLMQDNATFQTLMASTSVNEKEEEAEPAEAAADESKKTEKLDKKKEKQAALMQKEDRGSDNIAWGVYTAYVRAAGSILVAPLVLFLLIITNGATVVTSLWLSWWTSNKFGYSEGTYIGVYAALGIFQACCTFSFSVACSVFSAEAGKKMLDAAIFRVLRAPMSFFDTTPLGRITNRFSKDIDTMDNNLGDSWRMFLMTMSMIISIFILIIAYFYYFAIALVPLSVIFCFAAAYYRASAREIKRHESVLRSTVFTRFSEAVSGIATIRAYGLEEQFSNSTIDAVNDMNSAYFLTFANQRWLSVRLDIIGNALVFVTGILVVTSRFNVDPSISGLVLSYILSVVQMIQFTVRQLAEVENNMNATERIHHYGTELEQEPPLHLGDVSSSWPQSGEIKFDHVQMRYRDGLPLVLRDFHMHVRGGERIGVVGRTGAGKSTIMQTLFRFVELSGGSITIDGVNISTIGLHDLRSRLAIIPQDPTLFRGTVRSNLDPFNEHTDLELWNALRQAYLVEAKTGDENIDNKKSKDRIQLDTAVEEEGLNFSLGQRQLMALARALVRDSQIIICDEATSSVDMETDAKVQATMADGFRGKTLLCIAHRLKTIIGYDRICVMDAGGIAELARPLDLFDRGGIFRGMCDKSAIRRDDIIAEQKAMDRGFVPVEAGFSPASRAHPTEAVESIYTHSRHTSRDESRLADTLGPVADHRFSGSSSGSSSNSCDSRQRGKLRGPVITRQWSDFASHGFGEEHSDDEEEEGERNEIDNLDALGPEIGQLGDSLGRVSSRRSRASGYESGIER